MGLPVADRAARRAGPGRWRGIARWAAGALALLAAMSAPAAANEPVRLRIVGGLAGIAQFTRFEEPFWTGRIAALSGGRIEATIRPFDKSGLRGQDMLQLMRLGVVPWGTVLLSMAAADAPELTAVDLPGLNPDMASLRRAVTAYRPLIGRVLAERHNIELIGIYAYPAQVIFCKEPFGSLSDLAGRRVRTSSVAQSEFVSGLGGTGVITPFAEMNAAIEDGVVDCAITGTLSGHEIGLSQTTSHVHAMAVSWGISVFGAHQAAWRGLSPELQDVLRKGVAQLEAEIWQSAELETTRGLACNAGTETCGEQPQGTMTVVPVSAADQTTIRKLLVDTVLPRWIERCGQACVRSWNEALASPTGVSLSAH